MRFIDRIYLHCVVYNTIRRRYRRVHHLDFVAKVWLLWFYSLHRMFPLFVPHFAKTEKLNKMVTIN